MSQPSLYWQEPLLPWTGTEHDRRFRRYAIVSLILFLIVGLVVPYLPRPEPVQKELKDVAPRLAKLILEKKKTPPPPPPKPEVKKPEAKDKKAEPKPKPKPKPKEAARKKAERTGLLAMRDELADLRDSFDLKQVKKPVTRKAEQAVEQQNSEILTAKASQGSGGINTQQLSRNTGGKQLTGRTTTGVSSNIASAGATTERRTRSGQAGRGAEEIELVFQRNKSTIFSQYNRALRRDPGLQGKVVLELTIEPNGVVSACRIVSSELNHARLERKLVALVKTFRFSAKDVATITITYPIDFLPS